MNKHILPILGIALAAWQSAGLSTLAQERVEVKKRVAASESLRPGVIERVEIHESDDAADPLSMARAAAGDAEHRIGRLFSVSDDAVERPMIVSSSSLDEKAIATIEEDVSIMARLLDKAIDREDDGEDRKAMGIHLWTMGRGGSRGARNLYIDGHGAIFTLTVNTPLIAPAEKPQPAEKKESASSTWEEARRELYGRNNEGGPKWTSKERIPSVRYDADRVEALKGKVAGALKHASNIRDLKEQETVTVVLQGPGEDPVVRTRSSLGKKEVEVFALAGPGHAGGGRSIMTIRAKKTDIDAFAKGRMDAEEFRKKLAIATYQTAGPEPGGPKALF